MRTVFLHGMGALLVSGALVAGCGSDDENSGSSNTGGDTSSGGDASTGGKKSSGGDGGATGGTGGTGGKDAGGGTAGEGGARGEEGDLVKTLLIPGASNLYGLTYSADGKLYVSGTVDDEGDPAVALWRLDTEGNIDESFGDDGVVVRNLGAGSDASYGVVELANGDLVVHGTLDGRVFLMKFDDEGALVTEPTFVEFGWSEADLDAMTTPPFADWPGDAPPAYTSWASRSTRPATTRRSSSSPMARPGRAISTPRTSSARTTTTGSRASSRATSPRTPASTAGRPSGSTWTARTPRTTRAEASWRPTARSSRRATRTSAKATTSP